MDTVARDWRLAKAWLMRELSEKKSEEARAMEQDRKHFSQGSRGGRKPAQFRD